LRSEFGELKIKVWDTDKNLAPQLANAILEKLNSLHQALQAANNKRVLEILKTGRLKLQKNLDSMRAVRIVGTNALSALDNNMLNTDRQLEQYDELIGEYQLIIDTNPAVLVVVEKARASVKPDKPGIMRILVATAVISFLFSLLLALFLERRKRRVL
jgi:hypothetical protein